MKRFFIMVIIITVLTTSMSAIAELTTKSAAYNMVNLEDYLRDMWNPFSPAIIEQTENTTTVFMPIFKTQFRLKTEEGGNIDEMELIELFVDAYEQIEKHPEWYSIREMLFYIKYYVDDEPEFALFMNSRQIALYAEWGENMTGVLIERDMVRIDPDDLSWSVRSEAFGALVHRMLENLN